MHPNFAFNPFALLTAIVAAFFFGFLWYGPLLGKTWGRYMGMDMTKKPDQAFMMKAMGLQVLGLFFTAFVLAFWVQVPRPSIWGGGPDGPAALYGFLAASSAWLGFKVPLQFGKVSWEGRPWPVFVINTCYDFLHLQLIAQILAHWR